MTIIEKVKLAMLEYYAADPKRIQHFLKVHSLSKLIAEAENIDEKTLFTLEIAALTHDIGIKPAEEKHGSCSGKLQEKEGIAPAVAMLTKLQLENDVIERVCFLIAHHHTYNNIDSIDYQILVEADFLVNLFEDDESKEAVKSVLDKIFKTKTGIHLCETMFGV